MSVGFDYRFGALAIGVAVAFGRWSTGPASAVMAAACSVATAASYVASGVGVIVMVGSIARAPHGTGGVEVGTLVTRGHDAPHGVAVTRGEPQQPAGASSGENMAPTGKK
jgi:hypothetical protein